MKQIGIGEIKENLQLLDTAVIQWSNANPPENIYESLQEARTKIERCKDLCEAPLRVALVGEFNSGKTLLLNSFLDTTDMFPCMLKPTTGNVLEVRVHLSKEEKPVNVRGATVVFFNDQEIWEILNYFLHDLKAQGCSGLPDRVKDVGDLPKVEDGIISSFQKTQDFTVKYTLMAALEYVLSIKHNQAVCLREERHKASIPHNLLGNALTLTGRPELEKGIESYRNTLQKMQQTVGGFSPDDSLNSKNIRAVFPLMRRVLVEVDSWSVPFGIENPENYNPLSFLDFPGLGAENSSSRDRFLCMNEIRDAHAVLIVFNAANPGTAGASVMASLFEQAGKLTGDRTLIAVNRFDEFQPLPSETNSVEEYMSTDQEGTKVGFTNVITPAKNILAGGSVNLYLCSALSYLFEAKAERGNWNFGSKDWFNDGKRQAAYSLYKRTLPEFNEVVREIDKKRLSGDFALLKKSLQRYTESGGLTPIREDLVKFAREKGERLIKEDIMKEYRSLIRLLDEVTPASTGESSGDVSVSSEITYRAQEFYRVLELAVADALPSGPSDYKKLKIRDTDRDVVLWDTIETEITSEVARWPEWFSILNQSQAAKKSASSARSQKPQRSFSRYSKIKKAGGEVPTEFKAFDTRFKDTAEALSQYALEKISEAVVYSVQRFESHPDYQDACQSFQGVLQTEKLPNIEEALPLLDAWQPTQMVEEALVPEILERIAEEVEELRNIRYPYDGDKPCFWNLALVIRIQVQLVKTLRDKISRLIAASESQFQSFFVGEVLRAEILPLVRSCLNDTQFLAEVASNDLPEGETEDRSWEIAGQSLRTTLERAKGNEVGGGFQGQSAATAQTDAEEEGEGGEEGFEEW